MRKRSKILIVALPLAALSWGIVAVWAMRRAPAAGRVDAGLRYAQEGKAGRAEAEWLAAVKIDPVNAAAWELLGEMYLAENRWNEAGKAFEQVRRIRPNTPKINCRLAGCALRLGMDGAALRYAQEELRRDPNDVSSLAISAHLLAPSGDDQKLLGYLRKLAKLQPEDVEFQAMLVESLMQKRRFAEARPVLNRIITLDPNNAQAYAFRGACWMEENPTPENMRNAEGDLRAALKINPLAPFARFYLGKLYKRRGQFAQAVPQLEASARLSADRPEVFFELAEAYERTGRKALASRARKQFSAIRAELDAISELEKRCSIDSQDLEKHLQLGLLKLKRRDLRKAGVYLGRALALRPEDERVKAAVRQLENAAGYAEQRKSLEEKATPRASQGGMQAGL